MKVVLNMPIDLIIQVDRERTTIQVFTITKSQWLDVTEVEFQPGPEEGTLAKVNIVSVLRATITSEVAFVLVEPLSRKQIHGLTKSCQHER